MYHHVYYVVGDNVEIEYEEKSFESSSSYADNYVDYSAVTDKPRIQPRMVNGFSANGKRQ